MLGCKCLLNEQEQMVFLWLVLQVCSWRTTHFILRYIGVMRLCGMRLQSRGLKWDLLFQNPLLQILPAQLHLLKFAFPCPGCLLVLCCRCVQERGNGNLYFISKCLIAALKMLFRIQNYSHLGCQCNSHCAYSPPFFCVFTGEDVGPGLLLPNQNIVSGISKASDSQSNHAVGFKRVILNSATSSSRLSWARLCTQLKQENYPRNQCQLPCNLPFLSDLLCSWFTSKSSYFQHSSL